MYLRSRGGGGVEVADGIAQNLGEVDFLRAFLEQAPQC